MNNLAWKGDSGIAAKKFETIKDYSIIPDEGLQELTIYNEFSFKIKSIIYADRYWTVQSLNKTDMSYPVTIITDKDIIWRNALNYTDADGVKGSVRKETNVPANTPTQVFIYGFNDFDISDDYTKVNCVAYATRKDITEFTVTFIPSYKGGLLLDGVNDFGKVTGMPIYKDYTVVADYQRLSQQYSTGIGGTCPISKSHIPNQGAFVMDAGTSSFVKTQCYSFGALSPVLTIDNSISCFHYQTKYIFDKQNINKGEGIDSDVLWLGTFRDIDSRFFNGAIYSLMSFPYSMSKFLIERQLKKHKLGTLYPNQVEFRPIIPEDENITKIDYFAVNSGTWTVIKPGDYVDVGAKIVLNVYTKLPYKIVGAFSTSFTGMSIRHSPTELNIFDVGGYIKDKTPQKIKFTLAVNEDIVQWNPIITANANYRINYYLIDSNNVWKSIKTGDYITIGAKLAFQITFDNDASELKEVVSSQLSDIVIEKRLSASGYNIYSTINSESPQNINITIDEYIRFEDIVQPYPALLLFNDENGNEVSWGGKFKVGSTITRIGSVADPESNLLSGLYSISGLSLNGKAVTSSTSIVEKQMVFKTTATYLLDDNEPKVILSPSRLRIPNSSYKILGYIPDISGHGNHGVIHNSAYAEGSGVNEDGSYQFDGVDDFVTIPTTVGGKQVLMKVNWQSDVEAVTLYDQRINLSDYEFAIYNGNRDLDDNPVMAYQGRNNGQTYIDGILNSNIKASELKAITHNITITNELSLGTNNTYPVIGSTRSNTHFAQMSLYDFMLFDDISTEDKIKELNEYVGIEAKVEKSPYY